MSAPSPTQRVLVVDSGITGCGPDLGFQRRKTAVTILGPPQEVTDWVVDSNWVKDVTEAMRRTDPGWTWS